MRDEYEIIIEGHRIDGALSFMAQGERICHQVDGITTTWCEAGGSLTFSQMTESDIQTLERIGDRTIVAGSGIRTAHTRREFYAEVVRLHRSHDRPTYDEVEVYHHVQIVLPQDHLSRQMRTGGKVSAHCHTSASFVAAPCQGIAATWDLVQLTRNEDSLTGQMDPTIVSRLVQVPQNCPTYSPAGTYALSVKIHNHTASSTTKPQAVTYDRWHQLVSATGLIIIPIEKLRSVGLDTGQGSLRAHVLVLQSADRDTEDISCHGIWDAE